MNNSERKHVFSGKTFRILTCLLLLVFIGSGCAPLRKKFTRKKKKDKKESAAFIPVLDPVDYPEKMFNPIREYKHQYSLWKVWMRDFQMALVDQNNRRGHSTQKRQIYILNQMATALEEMGSLLTQQKRNELSIYRQKLMGVLDMVKQPDAMYSINTVERNLLSIDKGIRNHFNARDIQNYLIQEL